MRKIILCYISIGILIPLVFQNAFISNYVLWDDDVLVINNPILKMPFWEALKFSFSTYYHGDYFPVTLMSYWFDVAIFGVNSIFQHVENLTLHVVVSLLLLTCLRKITKNDGLSFLITMVFAIHPLQTESVMWISERKSLLSAVFTFLTLLSYLHTYENKNERMWYALAVLFYIFAGLTKATTLLIPILFLQFDIFKYAQDLVKALRRFVPLAFLAILLIFIRIQAYTASVTMSGVNILNADYALTVPVRAMNAIGIYFKMFLFPFTNSAIYPDFQMTAWSLSVAASVAVVILTISWRIWKKDLLLRFFGLWFLLFLLPVLQIFPRINYINERYMYLPIVGITGLALYLVHPKYYKVLGVTLLLIMTPLSFVHSDAWTTNRKLWTQTLSIVPESEIALNNLALDYQNAGDLDQAATLYGKILSLNIDNSKKIFAYNNLANIYSDSRYSFFDPQKAIDLLQEGIMRTKRVRDSYEMRINLGSLYRTLGNKKEALSILSAVMVDLSQESDYYFQRLKPFVEGQIEKLK